ncbi:unnamed protein product [Vicia faba]|uniref:Protein kinase domain-containing protein n=1 Tax=Vicia faba TaxID=3906 RepID=A0AAV0ZLF2_VICFA|nr:unnamed protein product [Vicia faba]
MATKENHSTKWIILSLLLLSTTLSNSSKLKTTHSPHSDPTSLLAFKSKADINNHLNFTTKTPFCNWQGVQCNGPKVVRLILRNIDLAGVFAPHTLTLLDQLRVLSLQNNSLTGTIPDLSGLFNLKTLFLDNNHFSGSLPLSLFSLHRIKTIDFSHNNLSGDIPVDFINLDRLYYLRLSFNSFNGTIPPFNQSSLRTFDVSGNNLSGAVPLTTALSRFQPSSFALNPNLCGEIIRRECRPTTPFFAPTSSPTVGIGQSADVHGLIRQPYEKKHKHNRKAVIIGFSTGIIFLILSLTCFAVVVKKQRKKNGKGSSGSSVMASDAAATAEAAVVMQMEQERELEEKVKRAQVAKSGSLIFCAGESQVYTLDQLMKGSAELLGRGCLGTTYKAVLDNRLIVTVKRFDCGKMGGHVSKEVFERHMESVGGLRHPNLVPLRAYFQANHERLIIYDYQPNGSLFSLIHGSRSSRARPLHWTSCLKIAEDIAQGLSYIHQAWRLVHGNLKSTNVLLGPDFEACVTDYCLSVLTNPSTFDESF